MSVSAIDISKPVILYTGCTSISSLGIAAFEIPFRAAIEIPKEQIRLFYTTTTTSYTMYTTLELAR